MILSTIRRILREDLSRAGEVPKWADAMLEPLNQFIDQVALSLRNNLTFKDNFAGRQVSLTVTHDVAQEINPQSRNKVIGVLCVSAGGNVVTGFGWDTLSNGNISVTVQFAAGAATEANCTFQIQTG